jgi:hypothetical protein
VDAGNVTIEGVSAPLDRVVLSVRLCVMDQHMSGICVLNNTGVDTDWQFTHSFPIGTNDWRQFNRVLFVRPAVQAGVAPDDSPQELHMYAVFRWNNPDGAVALDGTDVQGHAVFVDAGTGRLVPRAAEPMECTAHTDVTSVREVANHPNAQQWADCGSQLLVEYVGDGRDPALEVIVRV